MGLDEPWVVKHKNRAYKPKQRDVSLDDPRVVKQKIWRLGERRLEEGGKMTGRRGEERPDDGVIYIIKVVLIHVIT